MELEINAKQCKGWTQVEEIGVYVVCTISNFSKDSERTWTLWKGTK